MSDSVSSHFSQLRAQPDLKIDSRERALQVSMLTIDAAAVAISGKATELIPVGSETAVCPIQLPQMQKRIETWGKYVAG